MNYTDFLKSKVVVAPKSGFAIDRGQLNPELKGHQKDAVQWAIAGGRRALFESFGLGKTAQEIEFCHQVVMHERVNDNPNAKALIVLPLGVKQEFSRDAVALLHYEAPPYVRTQAEADAYDGEIVMTNYERVRDGDIDPKKFCAVALDEASVLRSFGSKTYQTFLQKFRGVKYKLVCTATPSPNRYKELIHYAAFLEVMDSGQALTRFFQRDSTKANHLTLYPHKEQEFWLWVASWALLISKPSDLGYGDEGYDLPKLEIVKLMVLASVAFALGAAAMWQAVWQAADKKAKAAIELAETANRAISKAMQLRKLVLDRALLLGIMTEEERSAYDEDKTDDVPV